MKTFINGMSGIMQRINRINTMTAEEKQELKESIKYHHATIREYIDNNNLSHPIISALEDRQIVLMNAYNQL